ncbi:histone-like nucleoid-structuring protein Lsr2 [Corynebacterium aquilae]|uniref:Histone n=1 Tax=Corynebacterium aquilae DSM 44791 TaxID=1431546 RepID=A0A1L7CIQ3_9CORY|nr:Lsr2 family protein [Corynebacterium aquilae]APT85689.1 hypothetical protein CAQU_12300 [Corynebacterium aquilae DSM 44791]
MAQKQVTQYFDDIDHTPLSQDEVHVVRFGVDGTNYVLEVSEANAQAFHDAIARFVEHAQPDTTRTTTSTRSKRSGSGSTNSTGIPAKRIREWAQQNNIEVNDRGRLPQEVVDAYREAGGTF